MWSVSLTVKYAGLHMLCFTELNLSVVARNVDESGCSVLISIVSESVVVSSELAAVVACGSTFSPVALILFDAAAGVHAAVCLGEFEVATHDGVGRVQVDANIGDFELAAALL